MSQLNYLYSTLSCSQNVIVYLPYPGIKDGKGSAKPSTKKATININGGANVIDQVFQTAKGAVTIVDDSKLAALKECSSFKRWVEKGFITIETKLVDADEVAKDLTAKDNSAQITGEDHEARFEEGQTTADVDVESKAPRGKKRAK